MTAWLQKAGRVLLEALSAGGAAAGSAYAANPHMDGQQAATIAGSAAVLYMIGRILPQINLANAQPR